MNNSRLGATVSFPVARQQSLKFAVSRGVIVRTGTNFTALERRVSVALVHQEVT